MQYKHYSCCAVSVKDAQVFAYLIIFPSSGKKKTVWYRSEQTQISPVTSAILWLMDYIISDARCDPLLQFQIRAKSVALLTISASYCTHMWFSS